jgi:hypothetical protein
MCGTYGMANASGISTNVDTSSTLLFELILPEP